MKLTALYLAYSAAAAPIDMTPFPQGVVAPWASLAAENEALLEHLAKGVPQKLSPEMRDALYSYLFKEENGRYPNADRLCLTINGARPRCMANPSVYKEIYLAAENEALLEHLAKGVPQKLSPEMRDALYSYLFKEENGRYPNADRLCLTINGARPRCMANPSVYAEIRKEVFPDTTAPKGIVAPLPHAWDSLAAENEEFLEFLAKGVPQKLSPEMKEALYSYLFKEVNGRYPNADRLCLTINGARPRCMANPSVYAEIRKEVFPDTTAPEGVVAPLPW